MAEQNVYLQYFRRKVNILTKMKDKKELSHCKKLFDFFKATLETFQLQGWQKQGCQVLSDQLILFQTGGGRYCRTKY